MKTKKRNPLIFLVGGFLKITFHTKLKHEPSHLHFLILWITVLMNTDFFSSMQIATHCSQYSSHTLC